MEGWVAISEGIKRSKVLKSLTISMCASLNFQAFEDLGKGLKCNQSLQVIDFSYNDIHDECGGIIAKMIQEQVEMRDQIVWMAGLRGDIPEDIQKIGLKEFYLHHNRLGKTFIKAVGKVIKFDNYLRVLDLSFNKVDEKTVKEFFLPCLKVNKSLTNVDLRKNPGYCDTTK
jgi:Ran GTPase-activating protein (RanGAP) involved in mRNA processing and transport